MGKRVGQVIVEALEARDVERCYGIVGDTLNYFTDAMRESGKIAVRCHSETRARGTVSYLRCTPRPVSQLSRLI